MPARRTASKPARPTARGKTAKAAARPAARKAKAAPKAVRVAKPARKPVRKAPLPRGLKPAKREAPAAPAPKARSKPGTSSGKAFRLARASERAPAKPHRELPPPRPDAKVSDKPKSNLYVIDGVPTLVVADTDVKDSKIHLKLHAPGQLSLPTLQVLKVQHNFRILDQTNSQECRFVLKGKLGGQEPAPDLVRTGSGWMATRDRMGTNTQVFRVPPGRSRLELEVRGEVYTTDRKTGELVSKSLKNATTIVELHGT